MLYEYVLYSILVYNYVCGNFNLYFEFLFELNRCLQLKVFEVITGYTKFICYNCIILYSCLALFFVSFAYGGHFQMFIVRKFSAILMYLESFIVLYQSFDFRSNTKKSLCLIGNDKMINNSIFYCMLYSYVLCNYKYGIYLIYLAY